MLTLSAGLLAVVAFVADGARDGHRLVFDEPRRQGRLERRALAARVRPADRGDGVHLPMEPASPPARLVVARDRAPCCRSCSSLIVTVALERHLPAQLDVRPDVRAAGRVRRAVALDAAASIAFLYGVALAAQLEAVRAASPRPAADGGGRAASDGRRPTRAPAGAVSAAS